MTTDKFLLFLNPMFLFSAASLVVKLVVLVNGILAIFGVLTFLARILKGSSSQRSEVLNTLAWMGPAISGIGIAYVGYVFFLVIEPEMRSEPLQWLVSGGDLLIATEAGLLTALIGIVGNRILQRDQ
jgi:hypothetical protein